MSGLSDNLEGLELDGKYRLVKKIGEGGMGTVFEAYDPGLERSVAVKLYPAKDSDSKLRARFFKEIKTAAKLEHKNLVPVYDGDVDQGFLFYVMRLIPGVDLKQLLDDGPLEPERAMKYLGEIAAALECIHAAQYVHRDIKPANILVVEPGSHGEYPMLGDLGIARALEAPTGLTQGQPPGTPTYTAPETFKDWEADAKSDQYALACVLFEMLAGRPPFVADDVGEIRRLHIEEPAPDIAEFQPDATVAVRDALKKALSKDPGDRYSTVTEFAEEAQADSDASQVDDRPQRRLTPVEVSKALFGVSPDRDERASQLAMETFLTLWANGYKAPDGLPASPKRRNGALRSLALEENFLEGFDELAGGKMTVEQMGARLAKGQDFAGSSELSLAQDALHALVDERTLQGSSGATLLLPFSEPLLWFDARRSGSSAKPWAVRKVNMRGTGVTLGRMLLDPPDVESDPELHAQAVDAVEGIRAALQAPTPFSELAQRLQAAAPDELEKRTPEPDETAAWEAAETPHARPLAARLIRHCRNITQQEAVPPSAKLLQIRSILALDLAHHALVRSWEEVDTPEEYRFLLLSYTSEQRRANRVRVASEDAYLSARQQIAQGIIQTLAQLAEELAAGAEKVDWDAQFESRSRLEDIAEVFAESAPGDFPSLAGLVFEQSSGGGYNRPVDAYRVLLESISLLVGSGQYRYLRAQPELLSALIGAVGGAPITAEEFLGRLHDEWNFVVGEREMAGTVLVESLDGNLLARNSRALESLVVSSGLGLALSDQTCMIGPALKEFK